MKYNTETARAIEFLTDDRDWCREIHRQLPAADDLAVVYLKNVFEFVHTDIVEKRCDPEVTRAVLNIGSLFRISWRKLVCEVRERC